MLTKADFLGHQRASKALHVSIVCRYLEALSKLLHLQDVWNLLCLFLFRAFLLNATLCCCLLLTFVNLLIILRSNLSRCKLPLSHLLLAHLFLLVSEYIIVTIPKYGMILTLFGRAYMEYLRVVVLALPAINIVVLRHQKVHY